MPTYEDLLTEIEEISDKNGLKDYHAFVYWFIETNTNCLEHAGKDMATDSI